MRDKHSGIDLRPIEDFLGYNLRRAEIEVLQAFNAYFAEQGLRPALLTVLVLLRHNPGLNQTQLGNALGIKRANFVLLVNELEKKGWVTRKSRPNDKRAYALHLTKRGTAFTEKMERRHAELEAELATRLGPENRDQLMRLLKAARRLDFRG